MAGLTFLIVFLVLFLLIAVMPRLLRRFHIPTVVAIMLVGIVIGPNSLDLIRRLNHFLGRGYGLSPETCTTWSERNRRL